MRKEKLEELKYLINMYKTVRSTKVKIVKGKFFKVGLASYELNNGERIVREEMIKNNGLSSASIILPITTNNEVVLIVQPRVLTKQGVSVELPAGYIDLGETGHDAAIRELREETGYIPQKVIKVMEYYQDQGCSRALNESFLAISCEKIGDQKLDQDEHISQFLCTYDEMLELVDLNYINDANSIVTIERSKPLIKKYMGECKHV
jgi:ADP-ribose pyrophosphatase